MLCVCALAFAASAQNRRGGSSLDRVLPQIRQSVPGTFYDAEGPFLSPEGQASYRIKWMTPDGRIIWFAVDARSGQILGGPPVNRYRAPEDERGWPRNNFRDGDQDSGPRYGERDGNGGWDRGSNRGDNRGWGRDEHDTRARNPGGGSGAGNGGRYDRGPERRPQRTPDRGNDRGHDRGRRPNR